MIATIAPVVIVVSAVSIVMAAKIVTTASTARGANNVKRAPIAQTKSVPVRQINFNTSLTPNHKGVG